MNNVNLLSLLQRPGRVETGPRIWFDMKASFGKIRFDGVGSLADPKRASSIPSRGWGSGRRLSLQSCWRGRRGHKPSNPRRLRRRRRNPRPPVRCQSCGEPLKRRKNRRPAIPVGPSPLEKPIPLTQVADGAEDLDHRLAEISKQLTTGSDLSNEERETRSQTEEVGKRAAV